MSLPIEHILKTKQNILYLGVGGGYDILGAVPMVYLARKPCVLANYNARLKSLRCYPGEADPQTYVEDRIQRWVNDRLMMACPSYALPKCGVKAMTQHLQSIVDKHGIEAIILIDGGVDSLMTGDEEGSGTWLDDAVTMIAANEMPVSVKVLTCLGFGTETEEGLCHHHVLRNIAEITAANGFYGACTLPYQDMYQEACEYVWENNRKSHIHTKVISALHGRFGTDNMYEGVDAQVIGGEEQETYISPLMSLYWFFSLEKVVRRNRLLSRLKQTNTSTDVMMVHRQAIDILESQKKARRDIPY